MTARTMPEKTVDRCDLCNYRFDGTLADRLGHLRRSHPRYARGLLLRLIAPFVFLVSVLVLSAVHASRTAFLVALFVSFGMLFFGKQRSRMERSKAGTRATLPMRRLVKEGGLWILLLLPIVLMLVFVLSKQ